MFERYKNNDVCFGDLIFLIISMLIGQEAGLKVCLGISICTSARLVIALPPAELPHPTSVRCLRILGDMKEASEVDYLKITHAAVWHARFCIAALLIYYIVTC